MNRLCLYILIGLAAALPDWIRVRANSLLTFPGRLNRFVRVKRSPKKSLIHILSCSGCEPASQPESRSSATPYIGIERIAQTVTALSIDDEKESEEEDKAMTQGRKEAVEPEAESKEEAGSEESDDEINEDAEDETEEESEA